MIIQQNGGQRRRIHTINLLLRNMSRQLRIQGMDSLNHQHIVRLHLQLLSTLHTLARREIIFRQLHLLATEESVKLLVQQIEIQGIDALKIIFAVVILRRPVSIHKVIVQRNLLQSVHGKLDAQSLAGCGLARRRRTSQQHELHTLTVRNILGYLGYLLLLQCLTDVDDVSGMTRLYRLVEVAHGSDTQDVLPAMVLLEDVEHLILLRHLAQFIRILERRNAQQHAIVILLQSEEIKSRSIGEQRAVIEIHIFTYFIIGGIDGT